MENGRYCCSIFIEQSHSDGRGADPQKTSYIIAVLPVYWRADCCLEESNNIHISIVACVYSVARCLPVRYLAIHVTILIAMMVVMVTATPILSKSL
jgi:hypothetical protein